MSLEFLRSLREEHLITPEGNYEEEYILEAPHVNEKVYYMDHGRCLNWIWMYDVLISKFGVRIPFTHFQFTILERIGATPSQLHPNSWVMIRGFKIICQYLKVPPSSNAFFYLLEINRELVIFPSSCKLESISIV